jgi:PTS system mannitol-specific IIA component
MEILKIDNIKLAASFVNKNEAIREAGRILVKNGYVAPGYIDCMLQRESVISTYVGNNVAVPHGISGSEHYIYQSGISVVVVPDGVKYSDIDEAKLIIGIAGRDGQHMDILGQIAMICSERENVEEILHAKTQQEILEIFQKELA